MKGSNDSKGTDGADSMGGTAKSGSVRKPRLAVWKFFL